MKPGLLRFSATALVLYSDGFWYKGKDMKKIQYLLLFVLALSSKGFVLASAQLNFGLGISPYARTEIGGSPLAMTAYKDNRLSTGTYKNKNAMQFFVTYDKDMMSFFGFRAGFSYKRIAKLTDTSFTYNYDDGNFLYDINAMVGDLDLKFKWEPMYLTLGLNYPFLYSVDDTQNLSEEGDIGIQGSLGVTVWHIFGFEIFYQEIKGKLVHRNTQTTQVTANFKTPLVGASFYFSLSL